ncbi:MAG: hypothetical protein ABW352_21490 [Polyangiales bacterium]
MTRPRIARTALALLLWLLPAYASANANCMESDNQCDPDKLCTFKAALAEKVFIYQAYLRNSQKTRRWGGREGIKYDGKLYDASIAEAKDAFPNASAEDQLVKAGQIFQEKIRKYAEDNFKTPTCQGGGMVKLSLFPKAGYTGAYTNDRCQVWFKYNGGEYSAQGFGSTDMTPCQEFYDRDLAHEMIHKASCEAAKTSGKNLDRIDNMIEDEIAAYRHSVWLTKAYVRLLSIRCSKLPNRDELKKRVQRIEDLLSPYLMKAGN